MGFAEWWKKQREQRFKMTWPYAAVAIAWIVVFLGGFMWILGSMITAPVEVRADCALANWTELPDGLTYAGGARMIPEGRCEFEIHGPVWILNRMR